MLSLRKYLWSLLTVSVLEIIISWDLYSTRSAEAIWFLFLRIKISYHLDSKNAISKLLSHLLIESDTGVMHLYQKRIEHSDKQLCVERLKEMNYFQKKNPSCVILLLSLQRRWTNIKIPLCLSVPVPKSLI